MTFSDGFDHLEALKDCRGQIRDIFILPGFDGHQATIANTAKDPLF